MPQNNEIVFIPVVGKHATGRFHDRSAWEQKLFVFRNQTELPRVIKLAKTTEKPITNSNCSPEVVYLGQKWYQFICKMVLKKYLPQTIYVIVTRIFCSAFIIRGRLFTGIQEHITGFSKSTDCSLIGSIVSNWIVKIRVIYFFSFCHVLSSSRSGGFLNRLFISQVKWNGNLLNSIHSWIAHFARM